MGVEARQGAAVVATVLGPTAAVGVEQGWSAVVLVAMGMSTLGAFLLVIAPYTWPLGSTRFGGPRLRTDWRLNGQRDLRLTVPRGGTRVGLLEVQVENRDRADVDPANVSLEVPIGLGLQASGPNFNAVTVGETRPRDALREQLVRRREVIPGRDREPFYYLLHFRAPGTYEAHFTVISQVLFRKLDQTRDIVVEHEEEAEVPPPDSLDSVIEEGRDLLRMQPDAIIDYERELRLGAMGMTLAAANVLTEAEFDRLQSAALRYEGPQSGPAYLRALIDSKVQYLESVRRQRD